MTLDEALEKLPDVLKRDLDKNLCICNEVNRLKVIEAIAAGADTREKVIAQTYASDGTGCCKLQIKRIIDALYPQHQA
jgi:NAD(P)H-nitrite reductase large subunit